MAELAADTYVPLEERLAHYLDNVKEKDRKDPLGLSDKPNDLMKPFYFYGGYVALSAQELFEYRESEKIKHLQRVMLDVMDQSKA